MSDIQQHEGIGTIKIKSKRNPEIVSTVVTPNPDDKFSFALLHSATAAIMAPMSGGHRTVPFNGQDHEDDDDEEEDVLADDGLSSSSDDDYADALRGDELGGSPHAVDPVETIVETISDKSTGLPPTDPCSSAMNERLSDPEGLLTPPQKGKRPPSRPTSLHGYFDRPTQHEPAESPGLSVPGTPGSSKKRPYFARYKSATPSKKSTKDFNFDANQGRDVLGIVMVEIKSAMDLPKIKNCKADRITCNCGSRV